VISGALIFVLVSSAGAIVFLSFLYFEIYHRIQVHTFGWFKKHMTRSVFWTTIFFLFLPIYVSVALVPFVISNFTGIALPTVGLSLILSPLVIGSGFLGWRLSFNLHARKLREIGAWGWPENKDG